MILYVESRTVTELQLAREHLLRNIQQLERDRAQLTDSAGQAILDELINASRRVFYELSSIQPL